MTTFKISYSRYSFTNIDTNEILIWASDFFFNPAKLAHHARISLNSFIFTYILKADGSLAKKWYYFQYLFFVPKRTQ